MAAGLLRAGHVANGPHPGAKLAAGRLPVPCRCQRLGRAQGRRDAEADPRTGRVDWQDRQLGYLPRAENRAVAIEMDRGGRVEARIAQLRSHPNPWQRMLIEVFVVL